MRFTTRNAVLTFSPLYVIAAAAAAADVKVLKIQYHAAVDVDDVRLSTTI